MYKNFAREHNQAGQTAVLFALMIVGLVAFIGLAVDGGSVFYARRVVQNAADSAALTGVHYIVGSDAPTETRLRQVVNGVIEANDIPDTDGNPGNEINDNVTIYYTDADGDRLDDQPCHIVPCGSIPTPARGLEVVVDHQVSTYFLGVIDRDSLAVAADAVAIVTGGTGGASVGDDVLVAFGNCGSESDEPLDFSGSDIDVIGGVHSSTWFANTDNDNHYHGQVTYGEGYGWSNPDVPTVYEPNPPGHPITTTTTPGQDPLAGRFTVADFACDGGSIGGDAGVTCYDFTDYAGDPDFDGVIDNWFLRHRSPDGGDPYLDEDTGALRSGLYYGGQYPFDFGQRDMRGTVTIVSSGYIKISGGNVQLDSYLADGSSIPGLLLYSALDPADGGYNACTNHEVLPEEWKPIDTTGSSLAGGGARPVVYHDENERYDDGYGYDEDLGYELGDLKYVGLIYAPYGRVATSGAGASYQGAIIAPSIRINGGGNRSGPTGDRVGALFVSNPNLVPPTEQLISLER